MQVTHEFKPGEENDPYIGEIFEDKDWRSDGRRVRVSGYNSDRGRYSIRRVGGSRTTFVTRATLDKRFRKVSH